METKSIDLYVTASIEYDDSELPTSIADYLVTQGIETSSDTTISLQYFSAEYICDGFMVDLDTGVLGDEDIHSILVSKSSPVSGQSYSKNSAYASGVGLYTFSGSPSVGEFITFAYRYSGEDRQEYTVHT